MPKRYATIRAGSTLVPSEPPPLNISSPARDRCVMRRLGGLARQPAPSGIIARCFTGSIRREIQSTDTPGRWQVKIRLPPQCQLPLPIRITLDQREVHLLHREHERLNAIFATGVTAVLMIRSVQFVVALEFATRSLRRSGKTGNDVRIAHFESALNENGHDRSPCRRAEVRVPVIARQKHC